MVVSRATTTTKVRQAVLAVLLLLGIVMVGIMVSADQVDAQDGTAAQATPVAPTCPEGYSGYESTRVVLYGADIVCARVIPPIVTTYVDTCPVRLTSRGTAPDKECVGAIVRGFVTNGQVSCRSNDSDWVVVDPSIPTCQRVIELPHTTYRCAPGFAPDFDRYTGPQEPRTCTRVIVVIDPFDDTPVGTPGYLATTTSLACPPEYVLVADDGGLTGTCTLTFDAESCPAEYTSFPLDEGRRCTNTFTTDQQSRLATTECDRGLISWQGQCLLRDLHTCEADFTAVLADGVVPVCERVVDPRTNDLGELYCEEGYSLALGLGRCSLTVVPSSGDIVVTRCPEEDSVCIEQEVALRYIDEPTGACPLGFDEFDGQRCIASYVLPPSGSLGSVDCPNCSTAECSECTPSVCQDCSTTQCSTCAVHVQEDDDNYFGLVVTPVAPTVIVVQAPAVPAPMASTVVTPAVSALRAPVIVAAGTHALGAVQAADAVPSQPALAHTGSTHAPLTYFALALIAAGSVVVASRPRHR